jgi:hypothetical protein
VVAEVIESSKGQRIELVEGDARPAALSFVVDDLERWGQHLSSLGDVEMTAGDNLIEIVDPDGLRLRFEQG